MQNTYVILYNIRSAHNVGSIFRTADGTGVKKIFCVGTTPTPIDRFGRTRRDIAKVALGAEQTMSWEEREDISASVNELKQEGFEIVAVEQDKRSTDLKSYTPREKVAYIFGSETEGLPEEVLTLADVIVEIPMRGTKESLNVAVAAGIVLFSCY